jgi:hypothetical protein
MVLKIDRATWLQGEGGVRSYLFRREDGKKCCLGFYGKALGVEDRYLLQCKTPLTSSEKQVRNEESSPWTAWVLDHSVGAKECDVVSLMLLNDNPSIIPSVREKEVGEIFALHGVEVVFTGEYPLPSLLPY